MSYIKRIAVLAVVALAMSGNVASMNHTKAVTKAREIWSSLKQRIGCKNSENSVKEPLEDIGLVEGVISKEVRMKMKAKNAILNAENCSDSSLEYLSLMVDPYAAKRMDSIFEPSRAYANKCLTSDYVKEKVKSATAGSTVDFLSRDFIDRFYKRNPSYSLTLSFKGLDGYRRMLPLSSSAIIDAMNEDFASRNQDPREIFTKGVPTPALRAYLDEKLFDPCKRYTSAVEPFMSELSTAASFYDGGSRKLIAGLDQVAKDAIFRYRYCKEAYWEWNVMNFVVAYWLKN